MSYVRFMVMLAIAATAISFGAAYVALANEALFFWWTFVSILTLGTGAVSALEAISQHAKSFG